MTSARAAGRYAFIVQLYLTSFREAVATKADSAEQTIAASFYVHRETNIGYAGGCVVRKLGILARLPVFMVFYSIALAPTKSSVQAKKSRCR